jgi:hypothetical protein
MKLYWRYKKDGKWTWKPVTKNSPKNETGIWPVEIKWRDEEE